MKERGIIFGTPMVRALLASVKSQTRRIVKPQPHAVRWTGMVRDGHGGWVDDHGAPLRCPYGQPGDRLWVREAFTPQYFDNGATAYRTDWDGQPDGMIPQPRWKSPIHMPRWASRITLEITKVRIERLHDISEADARAEGVDRIGAQVPLHRDAYRLLWEDIHGLGAWAANPLVWVVDFRSIDDTSEDPQP